MGGVPYRRDQLHGEGETEARGEDAPRLWDWDGRVGISPKTVRKLTPNPAAWLTRVKPIRVGATFAPHPSPQPPRGTLSDGTGRIHPCPLSTWLGGGCPKRGGPRSPRGLAGAEGTPGPVLGGGRGSPDLRKQTGSRAGSSPPYLLARGSLVYRGFPLRSVLGFFNTFLLSPAPVRGPPRVGRGRFFCGGPKICFPSSACGETRGRGLALWDAGMLEVDRHGFSRVFLGGEGRGIGVQKGSVRAVLCPNFPSCWVCRRNGLTSFGVGSPVLGWARQF